MVSHADRGRSGNEMEFEVDPVRGGAVDALDDAYAKMARRVFCRHPARWIGLAHQYDRERRPRTARGALERRPRVFTSIIDGSRGTPRIAP